jgi:hypothetical protein
MPQLRLIDGVEITNEEKVKAENLHGYDFQDREIIFKSLLPEEKFVDRRISMIEDVVPESESESYESAHNPADSARINSDDRRNSTASVEHSIPSSKHSLN